MKSARHRSPRPDSMKCVRLDDGSIVRVGNEEAHEIVQGGRGLYTPKKDWKSHGTQKQR